MYSLEATPEFIADKKKDYWNYGFEEMAKYDIPAALTHISKQNPGKKIVYIGHS